jgi:hypothetical protein
LAVCLLLAGCPSAGSVYTIYNNTRWDLVIELKDGQLNWMPGTPLRIDSGMLNRLQWMSEAQGSFPVLAIRRGELTGVFKFTSPEYPIPEEYTVRAGSRVEYRLQLQEDGNLYIMQAEDSYPARHIRFQPAGFPMSSNNADFKLWPR